MHEALQSQSKSAKVHMAICPYATALSDYNSNNIYQNNHPLKQNVRNTINYPIKLTGALK